MIQSAFLSVWLMTMMSRIENASNIVRRGFHEAHLKGDASPVTNADIESSHQLTDGWTLTPIISEETWTTGATRLPDVVTWVDPLDATQEYTEGLTEYVSIMACLTEHGRPRAGIIHFPFRNETWAVVDNQIILRGSNTHAPPETVIVSRSHTGDVASYVNGYSVLAAGGSGYKSVEVLKGHAKVYLHTTKIKTWDICAADALIHAMNGTFVEWSTGNLFNYTTNLQTNGIFASTTISRNWFRVTMVIRSKFFQLTLITIAWILIYMYPARSALSDIPQTTNKPIRFVRCAVALLICYITWGVAQERIMSFEYNGERFKSPAVLVFLSRLIAAIFAYWHVRNQTTPFRLFSVASLTNVVSSISQYTALMSTIFPVVVVFKSLKLIPVLIVGRVCFKKRYKPVAYLLALGLAIGVSLTITQVKKTASEQSFTGLIFMISYVVADALTSQWQSYVFKTYDTPPLEMMWGVNTCSVIFTGIIVATSGQGGAATQFATRHPIFLAHVCMLCFPAVIGQWFIFKTIEQHGAAAFAMVMTSRQAFSLLVSCLLFGHQLDILSIVGIIIVIAILCVKTRVKLTYPSEYKKIPQVDVEKGN
tara:strand:+ start:8035 stop:9813 length:1779 start_codon:yes stop_codon:yes gene_type:complete